MREQASLREQLARAMDRPRQRYAHVQPVSQVVLRFPSANGPKAFAAIREQVLKWLGKRAGRPLPDEAWKGASFDLDDVGAQRTAAVAVEDPLYWTARLDDADKNVPRRIWTTEIGLALANPEEVLFGCRLYCVAHADNPPFEPSIPGIVRQILKSTPGVLDGRELNERPWRIECRDDVLELVSFLRDPARRRPLFLVSETLDGEPSPVSAEGLSRMLLGAAHVASISGEASFELSDMLGKEFSVFGGAVRTYRAGFDPDSDQPSVHPLALFDTIVGWPNGGAEAFQRFLVAQALRDSVARRQDMEHELPSFATVQAFAQRQSHAKALKEGLSDSELLKMALEDIESLKRSLVEERDTGRGLLDAADRERDEAIKNRDEAKAEAANLRSRIVLLEHALEQQNFNEEIIIPNSFDELEHWVNRHLSGSVVVLNRAYRAAKKSTFENPELAYETLLILKNLYVPMRRQGGLDRRDEYHRALQEHGLEEAPTFAAERAGEYGDEYFVTYGGRRRELDHHIKGSNARDERRGFRLYFFWDEESQQVVVGWLPSHLTNRAS
jgi:hypothetical protein